MVRLEEFPFGLSTPVDADFNSKMVRLEEPGEILEGGYKSISIPKWYD